jgi:hypothetical protein
VVRSRSVRHTSLKEVVIEIDAEMLRFTKYANKLCMMAQCKVPAKDCLFCDGTGLLCAGTVKKWMKGWRADGAKERCAVGSFGVIESSQSSSPPPKRRRHR